MTLEPSYERIQHYSSLNNSYKIKSNSSSYFRTNSLRRQKSLYIRESGKYIDNEYKKINIIFFGIKVFYKKFFYKINLNIIINFMNLFF